MSVERTTLVERGGNRPPTTLHLFTFDKQQTDTSRSVLQKTDQFTREYLTARSSLERFTTTVNVRLRRLIDLGYQLITQKEELMSSQTLGDVFLKLHSEMLKHDPQLTDTEFMDLFLKLAKIATKISPISSTRITNDGLRRNDAKITEIINKTAGEPPQWFKGTMSEWRLFIDDRSLFMWYLNPDFILSNTCAPGLTGKKALEAGLKGFVQSGFEPDWMDDDQMPNLDDVRAENIEDRKEWERVMREIKAISEQTKLLQEKDSSKFHKAIIWFERRKNQLLSQTKNLPDIVAYAYFMQNKVEYDLKPKEIIKLSSNQLSDRAVPGAKVLDRFFRKVESQTAVLSNTEFVALWIEKQMIDDGLITSTQGPLSPPQTEMVSNFFLDDATARVNLPKKLLFEIRPLANLLTENERQYLTNLAQDSVGAPCEYLIWELAELISPHLQAQQQFADKQTHTAANHLREHAIRWIRQNYNWAFANLRSSLSQNALIVEEPKRPEDATEAEPVQETNLLDIEDQDTIENALQGNLSGWQLFFIPDIDSSNIRNIEIKGDSLEERQQQLENIVRAHKVSITGKVSSIVDAIDWLVVVPQEVEQIRMHKDVRGERYKKLKRGAMRILYQLNPDERVIKFHLHKKKGWSYGF